MRYHFPATIAGGPPFECLCFLFFETFQEIGRTEFCPVVRLLMYSGHKAKGSFGSNPRYSSSQDNTYTFGWNLRDFFVELESLIIKIETHKKVEIVKFNFAETIFFHATLVVITNLHWSKIVSHN